MPSQAIIIGVTGGVGAGKSEFSRMSECIGASVVDADIVARNMIEKNQTIQSNLRKAFGDDIFSEDGQLFRQKLGRIVFSDPLKLQRLNQITCAPLQSAVEENIQKLKNTFPYIILDMAILFETGFDALCNHVVFIKASEKRRIEWIHKQRGWTPEEIQNRIHSQTPEQIYADQADTVIVNDSDLPSFREAAERFYIQFKSENPV